MKSSFPLTGGATHCYKCGYAFDRSSCVGHSDAPVPGDVSICIQCGAVMVFGGDNALRRPTGKELLVFSSDPRIKKAQAAIMFFVPPKGSA